MSVTGRLFKIASAVIGEKKEHIERKLHGKYGFQGRDNKDSVRDSYDYESKEDRSKERGPADTPGENKGLYEDLKIFNLPGNTCWKDVKHAYRSECKKYHSDLHQNDISKKEAAEEIMVIYNSAYERLKKHYGEK